MLIFASCVLQSKYENDMIEGSCSNLPGLKGLVNLLEVLPDLVRITCKDPLVTLRTNIVSVAVSLLMQYM